MHKTTKYTDTTIKRAILLNINEKINTVCSDYKVDEETFEALMESLVDAKIIKKIRNKNGKQTNDYVISDNEKFEKWSKGNIYKWIEKSTECIFSGIVEGITSSMIK